MDAAIEINNNILRDDLWDELSLCVRILLTFEMEKIVRVGELKHVSAEAEESVCSLADFRISVSIHLNSALHDSESRRANLCEKSKFSSGHLAGNKRQAV